LKIGTRWAGAAPPAPELAIHHFAQARKTISPIAG
jgi:hypothetical protein